LWYSPPSIKHGLSIVQVVPVFFALVAYAWPIISQKPFMYQDIRMICAPKIYTANTVAKLAECFAYSESSGTFTAVGGRARLKKKYPNARIREVEKNMSILPGLYDSHGHIMSVQ
jgi:hypothetical protein